jgi:DNA-binding HxlR family transcriptional regulator
LLIASQMAAHGWYTFGMQARNPAPAPRPAPPCPIARGADLLGDRWTLLILRNATVGMTRFDQFKADLGIADNILSARLGRLVDAGVLTRIPYRDNGRTRHEYRLTEAGAEVLPVLHALSRWGQRFTEPGEPADPMQVIHLACGHPTADDRVCDHCGRPLVRAEEAWLRPWRSATPVPLAQPVPGSPGASGPDDAGASPA